MTPVSWNFSRAADALSWDQSLNLRSITENKVSGAHTSEEMPNSLRAWAKAKGEARGSLKGWEAASLMPAAIDRARVFSTLPSAALAAIEDPALRILTFL